jgi:hypothetical protein
MKLRWIDSKGVTLHIEDGLPPVQSKCNESLRSRLISKK